MAKQNGSSKAEKEVDTSELICKSVSRVAFNSELVVLENAALKITLDIKDPELHGMYEKDEAYENPFE